MNTEIIIVPTTAILYKLIVGEDWYYGSTVESLSARLRDHYKRGLLSPDRKLYKAVATLGGWAKVTCEVIDTFPFVSKEELWRAEDRLIKMDNPHCLNINRAILTDEERSTQKAEVSKRCKKVVYDKNRQDPEWIAKERERAKSLYEQSKNDPAYMERKRKAALASYYRRKEGVRS
jgi:hypothetical protein